jgi:hypothetical protein
MSFINGKVGWAFSFNGTNADVRVPASASLNLGAGGGLTLEAWIKPASVTQQQPLLEWNSGSFGAQLWISTVPIGGGAGPGCLTVNLKDIGFRDHSFTTPGGLVASNVWQHVAETNGSTALYVIGALITQTNIGVFTPMTTGDLYLGLRPYDAGAGTRYMGQMDEVAVFNRALTAEEIRALYAASAAGMCPVNHSPVARCRDVVVPARMAGFANASVNDGSYDPDGDPITLIQSPPGPYPLGTNHVTLTVTDDKGASNSCSALVIVRLLRIRAILLPDGSARLQFIGREDKPYWIEVSGDLVTWTTLGTCMADADGNAEFTDLNAAHRSPRFYRAVEQ